MLKDKDKENNIIEAKSQMTEQEYQEFLPTRQYFVNHRQWQVKSANENLCTIKSTPLLI